MDIEQVKAQFPALGQKVNHHDLVYLDSAATSLKPTSVVQRMADFYAYETANVHRGAYALSDQATENYESVRNEWAQYIGAKNSSEIIFTSGTTEAINLVASSYGESFLSKGDEIILTEMEHHSNIVPWVRLAEKKEITLKIWTVNDEGELDIEDLKSMITEKTKLVAVTYCSNVLGTVNDVKAICDIVNKTHAKTLIDAAQVMSFQRINVSELGCDFLAFSTHKAFGPFGVGLLYAKQNLLEQMNPYKSGGSMISEVSFEKVSFLKSPQKFEAGTPHISGVIVSGESLKFLKSLNMDTIVTHEKSLLNCMREGLSDLPKIKFIGHSITQTNVLSFVFENIHSSDLGLLLDQQGIAVRTGHHCCQPLMARYGVDGTIRASLSVYNDKADVDKFIMAVKKARGFF